MTICKQLYLLVIIFLALFSSAWAVEYITGMPEELVVINGVSYPVPPPWYGNRVEAKALTVPPLKKIPERFSANNSRLFLLDEACLAFVKMAEQAEKEGILLQVDSSYRSSWYQKKIFIRMLEEGREFSDIIRYVAPPGYSEHALGTVVDFTPSNWRFAGTPAYTWLQKNANMYGFFETLPQYPQRKTPWEAWHWRYLGLEQ